MTDRQTDRHIEATGYITSPHSLAVIMHKETIEGSLTVAHICLRLFGYILDILRVIVV